MTKDNFRVKTAKNAKEIGKSFLVDIQLENAVDFGLPEIDDRYNIWRIPLKSKNGERIGEIVIDALTSFIDGSKTTAKEILENRLLGRTKQVQKRSDKKIRPKISNLRNTIGLGLDIYIPSLF